MTKDELDEWINKAKFIESTEEHVDDNGNIEGFRIFRKDGIYYRIEYCNNYPREKWGDNGYIRGVYEPELVKQITKKIKITEYVPISDLDIG